MSDSEDEVREKALALLSRREHSRSELADKLARRGFDAPAVDAVLTALVDQGLLSDARYAELFVAGRAARGQGPLRIAAELGVRGVDESLAVEAIEPRAARWAELARAARGKRFGPGIPRDFPERARQARFLERRGFTGEQVHAALGGGEDVDDEA